MKIRVCPVCFLKYIFEYNFGPSIVFGLILYFNGSVWFK